MSTGWTNRQLYVKQPETYQEIKTWCCYCRGRQWECTLRKFRHLASAKALPVKSREANQQTGSGKKRSILVFQQWHRSADTNSLLLILCKYYLIASCNFSIACTTQMAPTPQTAGTASSSHNIAPSSNWSSYSLLT